MKLMIKESEDREMNYIQFATQVAEDIHDELMRDTLDNNVHIGKLCTDEYPDCLYCFFKFRQPYGNDARSYSVYGEKYVKLIDNILKRIDLKGYFRSAWSDYKFDKYNKCIEIGIRFMFNSH